MRAIDKNITKYASIQAFAVVMIALTVLLGWFFSITFFQYPLSIWGAMNPATSIGFIFSGSSFLLLNTKTYSKTKHIIASILAGCVCFIGILKILELLTNIELGLDNIIYTITSGEGNRSLNAMSTASGACFILIGSSLFLLNMDVFPRPVLAHLLAFITALISLFSLLCVFFAATGSNLFITPLSVHTSLCFLFISVSILFINADTGLFKEFTGKLSGSITAKFLIPVAIIFPVLFGYLRIYGEHAGWFNAELGSAFYSVILVCLSLVVIHLNSKMLNKRDVLRNRIEERLENLNIELESRVRAGSEEILKNEKIYQTIASNIPNSAIFILDKNENFTLIEGDILDKLGYSKKDIHKNVREVMPETRYNVAGPLYKRMLKGERFSVQRRVNGYDLFVQFVPLVNEDGIVEQGMVISIDVTEIKIAENEIRELNLKLEKKVVAGTEQLIAANKELEAFSYSVSHDLRAPLRAVDGYTRMIQEDYGHMFDEEGKRLLETVQSNAKRMGVLIDDLLAFSRLGKKELIKNEVNMTANASAALTEINKTVDHRSAVIIDDLHPSRADYGLISQVFINLISNAIKYSAKKEKPVIRVHSEMRENEIIYSVADNGAGFDMRYVSKLFGVFQRLHGIEEFEGTGVGLAIVKRIVNKHGGRVWAEGKPGEGATFYFTLPVKDESNG